MQATELWTEYIDLPTVEKWRFIRQYRAELLAACDWTQLPDTVLTFDERTAWQTYRQTLRDLPQSNADPDMVIFPMRP